MRRHWWIWLVLLLLLVLVVGYGLTPGSPAPATTVPVVASAPALAQPPKTTPATTTMVAAAPAVPASAPETKPLTSEPAATKAAATRPMPAKPYPAEPASHDPVMVKDGDYYYTYWTGGGINASRSKDLIHWERLPSVFGGGGGGRRGGAGGGAGRGGAGAPAAAPATGPAADAPSELLPMLAESKTQSNLTTWLALTDPFETYFTAAPAAGGGFGGGGGGGRGGFGGNAFPNAPVTPMPAWINQTLQGVNGLWAPDISFWGGKWHMYYAGSVFGRNTSVIGFATNTTLDPANPNYKWEDQGLVIQSRAADNYNCIDPNIFVDEKNTPWLAFGSFWTGIKLVKLDPATGKPDPKDSPILGLAQRGARGAIEGCFLVKHDKYYYLFVSFDACCNGLRSTYRVMIGRSEKLAGPYLDKAGADMRNGGGTQLLAGDGQRIIAPGHNAVLQDEYGWLFVCHFLDGNTPNGTARLRVQEMSWDTAGWPVLGRILNAQG